MATPAQSGPLLPGPLLVVGCGKMGGALLRGWLDQGMAAAADVTIVEPQPGPDAAQLMGAGVAHVDDLTALDPALRPAVVVFAVKPQGMDRIVPPYGALVRPETVFLSIAAGKTLAFFQQALGAAAAVVRAMPNTPAAVGHGMSVLCPSTAVTADQRDLCGRLLSAVGEVAWIDDEALMDAVTAVSGSGPAYAFLLVEALAQAGVDSGLPAPLAAQLARVTVAGSGALLARSSDDAATLRVNVTSPGGTTEAALQVLMAPDGLPPLLRRAVAAATARSRELA